MDLSGINKSVEIKQLPTKRLQDLPQGEKFLIVSLKIVKTRFGEVPVVECPEFKTYLPKRSTQVIKENLENFRPNYYYLIFEGLQDIGKGYPATNFIIVE